MTTTLAAVILLAPVLLVIGGYIVGYLDGKDH